MPSLATLSIGAQILILIAAIGGLVAMLIGVGIARRMERQGRRSPKAAHTRGAVARSEPRFSRERPRKADTGWQALAKLPTPEGLAIRALTTLNAPAPDEQARRQRKQLIFGLAFAIIVVAVVLGGISD
jgi:hypothetical protein